MGGFIPGSFKVVSLSEIYGLTVAQIHRFYGIHRGDIFGEWPVFRPPKTQLLTSAEESGQSNEIRSPAEVVDAIKRGATHGFAQVRYMEGARQSLLQTGIIARQPR